MDHLEKYENSKVSAREAHMGLEHDEFDESIHVAMCSCLQLIAIAIYSKETEFSEHFKDNILPEFNSSIEHDSLEGFANALDKTRIDLKSFLELSHSAQNKDFKDVVHALAHTVGYLTGIFEARLEE